MDRKSQAKLTIGAVLFFSIFLLLAFYTSNPDKAMVNESSYVEECKPYFLNGVKCPLDNNNSSSKPVENNTEVVNGSVENG